MGVGVGGGKLLSQLFGASCLERVNAAAAACVNVS